MVNRKKIASLLLLLLALGFIWGNSLLPGEASGAVSGGLLVRLAALLGQWILSDGFHLFLRKLAHFSEFAALAPAVFWFLRQWRRAGAEIVPPALLMGLMAAAADEAIQLFVPGRGSSVADVWIDFAGFFLGLAVTYGLRRLPRRRGRK